MKKLATTVLSGFLGSGKTTLLQRLLTNTQGWKVAVIVNDMSEINVDANSVQGSISLSHSEAKLVEMSNGCICCTLREDLIVEVRRLAETREFDYLIVESTGISEPMPVAATFQFRDPSGFSLSDLAYVDTMVTVVDCQTFLSQTANNSPLPEDDTRTLTSLLVEQVEFADVILLNKIDLVDAPTLAKTRQAVSILNPRAKLVESVKGDVPLELILSTGAFNLEVAQTSSGWYQELDGKHHQSETEEYGISSFVYRARRPFHPARLASVLGQEWPGLLRSKGYAWLATRRDLGFWSSAGNQFSITRGGKWWADVPRQKWPSPGDWNDTWLKERWREPNGDRRQEIVFIGQDLSPPLIRQTLDECLVDDQELPLAVTLPDPLPSWS